MRGHTSKRTEVNKGSPCQLCGASRGCSVGQDGLFLCRGGKGDVTGFFKIGPSKHDSQFVAYRANNDPLLYRNQGSAAHNTSGKRAEKENAENSGNELLLPKALAWAEALVDARGVELAEHLGLPPYCLYSMPMIGLNKRDREGACWTFPEMDGEGHLVGIMRRWPDGHKKQVGNAPRGLTVPDHWTDGEGALYICEGASDTLAMVAMGLNAIGVPSAGGGLDYLPTLLNEWPKERAIVVVGDMDPTPEGKWPGKEGAVKIASVLSGLLKRPVLWTLPPQGIKDVRAWTGCGQSDGFEMESWHAMGERFEAAIKLLKVDAATPDASDGLIVTTMSKVKPKIIRWLVPQYFPTGELCLFGADSTMGKSIVTSHMASMLSRGWPCFGLDYQEREPVESLIFNMEDGREDSILPRLQAMDADLSKIHHVEGMADAEGKLRPWGLGDLARLRNHLGRYPQIKYVVIDPIDSYLFGTGVDDFKSSSTRECVTDPLNKLAKEKGVLIKMVLHCNKGESKKAVNRLANSVAYYTGSRVGYMAFFEPGSTERRVFTCEKLQYRKKPMNLLYRIALANPTRQAMVLDQVKDDLSSEDLQEYAYSLATAEWLGYTELTGDDCCSFEGMIEQENHFDKDKASAWLRNYLQTGPKTAQDCMDSGNAHMESRHDVRWWRDKILGAKLGGESKHDGRYSRWLWCLPGQDATMGLPPEN
jgi:hypothetical protein